MKKEKKKLSGICVSPGEATGRIRIYKEGEKYSKKDIVILDIWVTSGVVLLKNSGGLISSRGGLTCHASIIAREYGIPCLVGVRNLKKLKEGNRVTLDATRELISLL